MHFKVNQWNLDVQTSVLLMILTPMKRTTVGLKQYKNVSCISLIILH